MAQSSRIYTSGPAARVHEANACTLAGPRLSNLQPSTFLLAPPRAGLPLPSAVAVCGPPIYRHGLGPPARLAAGASTQPLGLDACSPLSVVSSPLPASERPGIAAWPMSGVGAASQLHPRISQDTVIPRLCPEFITSSECSQVPITAPPVPAIIDEELEADVLVSTSCCGAVAGPELSGEASAAPCLGAEEAVSAAVAESEPPLVDLLHSISSYGASAESESVRRALPEAITAPHLGNPQAAPEAGDDDATLLGAVSALSVSEGTPDIEPGDLVVLGQGAPPEHRRSPAVVMKVFEAHCTVVVLDESLRFGVGECWPMFQDVLPIQSRAWREGAPVVIHGLRGGKVRKLNGFTGTVVAHPREGHPSFIERPPKPKNDVADEGPQLVLCVRLEDPVAAGQKTVLLEPRFLVPRGPDTRRSPDKSSS